MPKYPKGNDWGEHSSTCKRLDLTSALRFCCLAFGVIPVGAEMQGHLSTQVCGFISKSEQEQEEDLKSWAPWHRNMRLLGMLLLRREWKQTSTWAQTQHIKSLAQQKCFYPFKYLFAGKCSKWFFTKHLLSQLPGDVYLSLGTAIPAAVARSSLDWEFVVLVASLQKFNREKLCRSLKSLN